MKCIRYRVISRIQVFVLFVCLFIYLLICLSVCLFVFIFVFISFHFIHSYLFHFVHSSILISFCLSILFYPFSFSFSIQKSRKRRRQPNQTRPNHTYLRFELSFLPSCVCVYEEAQAGQKKTLSSRPELLQKSGNVLVLGMQQQRLTVRRTGRGGMISRGLRTPEVKLHTLYSRIRIGKSMERVTTYFQRG